MARWVDRLPDLPVADILSADLGFKFHASGSLLRCRDISKRDGLADSRVVSTVPSD